MTIEEIYFKYKIPINLQEHMLRTAALGNIICNHIKKNLKVDKDLIVKTLLLHDMANILKFDLFETHLLDEADKLRVDELKQTQKDFRKKYGNNLDKATLLIIKEATSNKKIVALCETSHWEIAEKIVSDDDWNRKITCYSDMRIGPFGVLELKKRFNDLVKRRPHQKAKLKILFKHGAKLENQLQEVTDINLNKINNGMVEELMGKLKKLKI